MILNTRSSHAHVVTIYELHRRLRHETQPTKYKTNKTMMAIMVLLVLFQGVAVFAMIRIGAYVSD